MQLPQVLVLGGGGILGEAWMLGVLTGIEEVAGIDSRDADVFIGTSAGSIVAATLASGRTPRKRLGDLPPLNGGDPRSDGSATNGNGDRSALAGAALGAARTAIAAAAPLTLRASAPGGAFVRRAALARVPAGSNSLAALGHAVAQSGVTFDGGRLRVAAVELETGRRVMFGAPGAPETDPATAVRASCAIPGYFEPVRVGDRTYVDGGAWSPTNMDTAPVARGTRVLCLNPTASLRPTRGSVFGALGPVSRAVAGFEAIALERRGATVTNIAPDHGSAQAMGSDLMAYGPRDRVVAAGRAQGRSLAGR